MRLLVTGGMGFIGSNFIRYILTQRRDVEVVNLDCLSMGSNRANLADLAECERYKFIRGDITDSRLLGEILSGVDVVVNIAAETHVDRSIADPVPFFRSNCLGVFTLLEAARRLHVKVLQVSTDEVYGDIVEGSFREEDRLRPSSPYSATKACGDMLALAYHRTYGLDLTVVRCTNNYGPYQFPEKLIPKTIIRASKGLTIPVYGTGQNVRDWIYVIDFCDALEKLLDCGKPGEVYNVSSGVELQNIEVVKAILKVMGMPEGLITFVEDRPGHDVRYSLDSSKIRRELGWEPKHRFEEALEATVRWYSANKQWWDPLVNDEVLGITPWKHEH
ncbi:MAG: dTDP-glucose 4,6-dehydratase [Candidatus Bathyarchaeia archaeon]